MQRPPGNLVWAAAGTAIPAVDPNWDVNAGRRPNRTFTRLHSCRAIKRGAPNREVL